MDEIPLTPMLKQYLDIKKEYPGTILFFRMGDFYEMFFDDARTAAPILEVVLTSRNKNKEDAVPLCGIPYHAMDNYAAKLLRRGYKVAVCEQMEDPALAKGIVRREVTRILTPATALELEVGIDPAGGNTFLVSLNRSGEETALASIDLGTSDFAVRSFPEQRRDALAAELYRRGPKEIIVPRSEETEFCKLIGLFPELSGALVTVLEDEDFHPTGGEQLLKDHFHIDHIEGLGLAGQPAAVGAAASLLTYLRSVRKSALPNIVSLRFSSDEDHLVLDAVSFRNLEIVTNLRTGTGRGSLLEAVDLTVTPMGTRLLRNWLSYPLLDPARIEPRLDAIEEFLGNLIARTEIRKTLKTTADLARLTSRISLGIAQPRHLLQLSATLQRIPDLRRQIDHLQTALCRGMHDQLDPLDSLLDLIDRAIGADPAPDLSEGGVIRDGYNTELDDLRAISRHAKEIIAALEKTEREKTAISSLKVKYNKVFGYFIEVTHTHLKLVPPHYIRKQTLVNAERFITDELKELEDKILRAQERIIALEKSLYGEVISAIQGQTAALAQNAEAMARLDLLTAGAELAQKRNYCRPRFPARKNGEIRIEEGRHPILESGSVQGLQRFIPNDLTISGDRDQILIITGPNMGGKSTYLRQTALIVILAQAGCFVPASRAEIGPVDRIFTRIGAADSLIEGKSTFLVEMIETAIILNNATSRSLILLDEIGRGTSTYDGLSIAWAVIEYLHTLPARPRTLFATHYHELTELAEILERVKNYHISVKEWQESVIFLHKIVAGASDQSFGIHVAKIAGIPLTVIERAKEILLNLEKKELNRLVKERIAGRIETVPAKQKQLFPEDQELQVWDEIRNKLVATDISSLTPLEALNILHYLKVKSETFK